MKKSIWICIGRAGKNYAASAPEVPGCMATDDTIEATRERMRAALAMHLEGMVEDGEQLDGIIGAFPTDAGGDYCCEVEVEVAEPSAVPAGV